MTRIDDAGRLHCEDGPAIAYSDGWGIHSWHGVRVPPLVIEHPEQITLEMISGENNAEVKRITIERYGWLRYLEATKAKVLNRRRNEIEGTKEVLVQDNDGGRHLICACPSTGRTYALRVPRETKDCAAAQAWLAGGRFVKRVIGRT